MAAVPGSSGAALQLKVMSFNIRYAGAAADTGERAWTARRAACVRAILAHDPLVVCLQEALKHQYNDLLWLLNEAAGSERWVGIFAGRDDGYDGGEACPIIFQKASLFCEWTGTFWLSETPDKPGSRTPSWGNALPRICTAAVFNDTRAGSPSAGARFKLLNTHLDYESAEARRRGMAAIMHHVPADMHAVLVGDFNSPPGEAAVHKAAGRQLLDVAFAFGAGRAPTFHGFAGPAARPAPGDGDHIDYIYASPGVEVLRYAVDTHRYPPAGGVFPSDHYPVVAELRWRDAPIADIRAAGAGGAAAAGAGGAGTGSRRGSASS